MFEPGRSYMFVTNDHEGEVQFSAEVLEVDLPLVKIERVGNYQILNVHSSMFHSATPNDEAAKEAEKAAQAAWQNAMNVKFVGGNDDRYSELSEPREIGEDGWPKENS